MFCHKCGTDNGDDAAFCKKCGEGLKKETEVSPASIDKPNKKKFKKLFIIIGAIIVIIIAIVIVINWEGDTNYVATVQVHTPFENSQGINLTYATVFNKYIEDIKWETRKVGDIGYIDVSGNLKGNGDELLITTSVTPTDDNGIVKIVTTSATYDGDTITGNDAIEFLFFMFDAADRGYETLDEYLNDTSQSNFDAADNGYETLDEYLNDTSQSKTYTNAEAGITFNYPSNWIVSEPTTIVDIITIYDGNGVRFGISENYYLPFELSSGDEALIEASVNEIHEFVSVSNANINGHPMRELVYISELGIHGSTFNVNYFYFNGDMEYHILSSIPVDKIDYYQSIFDAILESYTVTSPVGSTLTEDEVLDSDMENKYPGEVLFDGFPAVWLFDCNYSVVSINRFPKRAFLTAIKPETPFLRAVPI